MGREYGRWFGMSISGFVQSLRKFEKSAGFPRVDEIKDFADRIEGGRQQEKSIVYFDKAKFLTLRTGDMYLSFKGSAPELLGAEICTNENYLAINLTYGTACCFLKKGDEYLNIGPLWDYSAIPGTTSRYETDAEIRSFPDFTWNKIVTDDFGGEKIGDDLAVCFVGSEHYGVNSMVTAFALPFGMVFLGAELREKEGKPIHTTVNQCFLRGDVAINDMGHEVIHDGVIYRSLDKYTTFRCAANHRHVDHFRNSIEKAKVDLEGDLLTVDIPVDPARPCYAYAVLPTEEKDNTVEVLRNDGVCQAIKLSDGRVVAVFHDNVEIELDGKTVIGKKNEIVVK
jgi:hypothetical protein